MMKCLLLCAVVLGLNSCNTLIGLGRDTKQAFNWSKQKIQGDGGSSSDDAAYGAPVY